MPLFARLILNLAAGLITLGGLYDVLIPSLPPNLINLCGDDPRAHKLARELLRALGGSLVAIGAAVALFVNNTDPQNLRHSLVLVLTLVLPSEGINAFSMYRVGSPFYIPMTFAFLVLLGVAAAWPGVIS